MKLNKRYFSILLFNFFIVLNGQNIKFKPLTTKDGLSNNSVNDLLSDNDGRLWIATWDGVNIYDGHNLITYKHIQKDSTSIAGNVVTDLKKDKNGKIWLLTDNNAISTYIGNGVFKNYYLKSQPNDIFLTKSKELAVLINDTTYFKFNNNNLIPILKNELQEQQPFKSLEKYLLKKYPDVIINDILKDNEGNIWYATRENGVFIIPNTPSNINNNYIEHYTYDQYSPYSFTSNEIEKLYQDSFKNIWLGHKDGGISMAYKGSERITTIVPHPKKYPHLPNETLRAITKDHTGKIWLGYYTKGLFYFNEKTNCYLPFTINEAEKNKDLNRIRSLYTDSYGNVWVGTYGGLIRINEQGYKLYNANTTNYFPANRNYSFSEDEQQLWIACWGGVAKFNLKKDSFEAFPNQNQLSKYSVRHINAEGENLTIATKQNGVLLFNKTKGIIKNITETNGILGNSTFYTYYDEQTNHYWIATLGGISIYNLKKGIVKNITEKDGLPSHMVYSLFKSNNEIWISTTKGIASVNMQTFKVSKLPPNQGWQGEEFSEGAAFQDQKGILYYGGINGLSFFKPNSYKLSNPIPKLKIVVDDNENYSSKILKNYSNNNLKIKITPVHFNNTSASIYYKLSGLNKDWSKLNKNEISYKDLPYGDYKFLTKIEDNQPTKVFHIQISKPFYKTNSFYLLALFTAFIIVLTLITRKNILSKKLQKRLEEKIIERTAIIESQKQDLILVNENLEEKNKEILNQKETLLALHHQIKNQDFEVDKFKNFVLSLFKPKLTKMLTLIQQLDKNALSTELQKETIHLSQLISEWDYLNQIKDLKKLKPTQVHFKNLIAKLYQQINYDRLASNSTFNYNLKTETDLILIDVLRFRLLFQYLINDVLKYTKKEDTLLVLCELNTNSLVIKIEGTGLFLKEQWQNAQKFSPYYKAVKSLISDLNGKLTTNFKEAFNLFVHIPISVLTTNQKKQSKVVLKHLYKEEEITGNKPIVLTLCEYEDINFVQQILQNKSYQLVFEHDIQTLTSIAQQLPLHALIIYNSPFTHQITQLLEKQRFQQFPVIYITEQIEFDWQEQALEAGVNTVIHLPVSVDFIHKKITALIRQYQLQHQSKIEVLSKNITNKTILNANEKIVKQAMLIIKEQLGNSDFNVDMLISELKISRTKCYRIFKELMEQSPSDIIITLRLQKAEQLLTLGHLNVSEVSFECGFSDPKYFSRLFKKYYGISPKSFQKQSTSPKSV